MSYKLRVLSLGAGVQSTTLYLMAEEGLIEPFDLAIFADTGWEREATYKVIEDLKAKYKTPIITVKEGDVKNDILNVLDNGFKNKNELFIKMPMYAYNGNDKIMLKRQCTAAYKIKPINKELRKLLGLKPYQRYTGEMIEHCIGISIDESQRMNKYQGNSIETVSFPLVDLKLNRNDCVEYLKQRNYIISKSACIGCPFHCNKEWRDLNDGEFKEACKFDNEVREGFLKLKNNELYIHNSLKPLSEVDLRTPEEKGQLRLFDYDKIKVFSNLTLSV